MRFRLFVLVIISATCQYRCFAQDIQFTAVEPSKTQPWSTIFAITQDPHGYLWLCANNGLYKYDGHQYTLYQHQVSNLNSLASNRTATAFADKRGIIWIGFSDAGLDKFDPEKNTFTHYRHKLNKQATSAADNVTAIIQDREGTMWVGTYNGLERFDPVTGKFESFSHNSKHPYSLSNNQVTALYEDRQGTIWVGTGSLDNPNCDGGLNKLDKKTGKFTRYLHDVNHPNSLIDNRVSAIFEDSRGTFWVGTAGDGLHTMDREKGTFERHEYDPADPEKLSRPPLKDQVYMADDITFINEDISGRIWIGTLGNGINVYTPLTQKTAWYADDIKSKEKAPTYGFFCSYKTRDGVLWVAPSPYGGGELYKISPFQNKLPHNNLGAPAFTFTEGDDGMLWIATDKGLMRDSANVLQPAKMGKNQIPLLNSYFYYNVDKGDNNTLWLASPLGLYLYHPVTHAATVYRHQKGVSTSLSSDLILFLKRIAGQLWVGTDQGLDVMDTKTGMFKHFMNNPKDSAGDVHGIATGEDDHLWIGTENGLVKLDEKTGRFKRYFSGSIIYYVFNDSRGDLWVGSDFGLLKYDKNTGEFATFFNYAAGSMIEDHNRNIWVSTLTGIAKIDLKNNNIIHYGKNQGVTNSINSAYLRKDGEVVFGDASGYFAFYPDKVLHSIPTPITIINNFLLADVSVKAAAGSVLTKPMDSTNEIHLNHNQATFSFGITSIDFVSDEGDSPILYKLENYDTEWRTGNPEETANYYNVAPGSYVFKVKTVNVNGLFSEKQVSIIISPPWWQTWWAYIIFIVLFAGSVWGFIHYRSLSLLRDKRILEHKVQLRTEEVLQQKEEIEAQRDNLEKAFGELKTTQSQLIQSEKMASLGELTAGIAHEIQNPLNFVNNFSEVSMELLDEMEAQLNAGDTNEAVAIANDIKQNLEKINHHGKRADSIVKGMLQHSRNTGGQKEATDINALVDEYLRLSYHGLRAKDKSFNAAMETHFDESAGEININPQDIGRVILNLLTNAFYSVNEKRKQQIADYNPAVTVSTQKINSPQGSPYIEIKVRDNGVGIPQKILDKIYQPFFTTKPTGQGTGLGLSMSYDIVKAHGGELHADTKDGVFTEFTVKLPLN